MRLECKRWLADGERWLLAAMMQATAGRWQALAGGNDDARVGWRMECKRWLADGECRLADGECRLSAEMMGALAGRWSASISWWRASANGNRRLAAMRCKRRLADGVQASAGGDDVASVGWQMECKRRLEDGERRLSGEMMRALASRWSASVGWWW